MASGVKYRIVSSHKEYVDKKCIKVKVLSHKNALIHYENIDVDEVGVVTFDVVKVKKSNKVDIPIEIQNHILYDIIVKSLEQKQMSL
jgi:hypothetical protein